MVSRRGRGGEWRRRESNPLLLGASEVFFLKNFIPECRCGRVESNHHSRGDGFTGRGAHRCPASARSSAGGIRTHGLELMRLAGTAAPLPRKSGRLESNQRSPVPETGGVAELPHGQLPIESTTVESNHARPPYQSGACPAGPSSVSCSRAGIRRADSRRSDPRLRRGTSLKASAFAAATAQGGSRAGIRSGGFRSRTSAGRRQGIAPCSTGSRPAGSLLALRRSLAGRIRTPVPPR